MKGQRKHSRAHVLITTLAVAVILVATGVALWRHGSREARKAHEDSAAASISAGVTVYLTDHPRVIEGLRGSPEGKWYVLSDREYDQIIPRVSQVHQLDVDPKRDSTEPLLDGWGNRYVIAVRAPRPGEADVAVFSKGPDGRLFTDDDLVRPHNLYVIRENDIDCG